jgi:Icc-related predicted phosphoesterase
MKIIAISDLHGNLINIRDKCDAVVIAGDWSPLYCQQDCVSVLHWLDKRFVPWMKSLKTDHVVVIPGNHDFAGTYNFFEDELDRILVRHRMIDKVHYLCHSSIIIDGKKFYGNPNNESPNGWAFSKQHNQTYEFDDDTDILITHQPPMIDDVGYVSRFNKELGSKELLVRILESNIELNICGHIHTGSHGEHQTILNNGNIARVYNVSILDEDYDVAYLPTVIEL